MPTMHVLILSCVVALLAACKPADSGVEETPPPAASAGDETALDADAAPPEPDAPPPAAQPAEAPEPKLPTIGAVVVQKVKDYAAWKTAFDNGIGVRAQAGVAVHSVSLDADKKNMVTVYLGGFDLEKLKAFGGSDELKAAMKAAGVVGKPQITYLTHPDSKPGEQPSENALMITHEVKDYDAWKTAFDAHADKRAQAGMTATFVCRDADKPNKVLVYVEGTNADALRAFTKDPELKKVMKEAGVVGKPTFTFLTPQDRHFYTPEDATKVPPPAPEADEKPAAKKPAAKTMAAPPAEEP